MSYDPITEDVPNNFLQFDDKLVALYGEDVESVVVKGAKELILDYLRDYYEGTDDPLLLLCNLFVTTELEDLIFVQTQFGIGGAMSQEYADDLLDKASIAITSAMSRIPIVNDPRPEQTD